MEEGIRTESWEKHFPFCPYCTPRGETAFFPLQRAKIAPRPIRFHTDCNFGGKRPLILILLHSRYLRDLQQEGFTRRQQKPSGSRPLLIDAFGLALSISQHLSIFPWDAHKHANTYSERVGERKRGGEREGAGGRSIERERERG